MEIGFSVYAGADKQVTHRAIEMASRAGIARAFTSLQIPEERGEEFHGRLFSMVDACRQAGIGLIADATPKALYNVGLSSIFDLSKIGVACIRLDYGFSDTEVVELTRQFDIALNASVASFDDVARWIAMGADPQRFVACHNFYPKPYTGLALEAVHACNIRLREHGIKTLAFIPGDDVLRGPLEAGLPTVEDHRRRLNEVIRNALELSVLAETDVVLVGDPALSAVGWQSFGSLSSGTIPLRTNMARGFSWLYGSCHRDRMDASPYVFRSVESRTDTVLARRLLNAAWKLHKGAGERKPGDIVLSLAAYGRYAGELEIARRDMPADEKTAVIGRVVPEDIHLLSLLPANVQVMLVQAESACDMHESNCFQSA